MSDNDAMQGGNETKQGPEKLERLLGALGNNIRVIILKKLARFPQTDSDLGGMYPGDLAEHLQITKQGVMKHLKLLADAGLIEEYHRDSPTPGPQRNYYRLTPIARDLLAVFERYETNQGTAREEISQAKEKLQRIAMPLEMKEVAELERALLDVDEQLGNLDYDRQDLLQKRLEIVQQIRQVTDQIVENRFKAMLEQGGISLDELSIERELLHAFFDNPIQAFSRGFDIEDLLDSMFAPTSRNTRFKRNEWERRILQFMEDLDIIKRDKSGKRLIFFI
ncbi:MAG: hypothetical protein RBG13Loki_4291 [Promethearchaeota archaeon CR_4]|nr:MAG: hypothetical protein RBG13Loki_4291 [Candidatus Lokiarchaeota archaeon CR_4]